MRKPEDGGLGEPDDWGADGAKWAAAFHETAIRLGYSDMDEGWLIGWFANAIERGRVAHPDTKRERATLAERDRWIADLEAGLETADSWLMLHARHVGSCLGKSLCTCGLTLVRAETGALLSGQQASEGRDG